MDLLEAVLDANAFAAQIRALPDGTRVEIKIVD
jgi:hypothetical protein